MNNQPYSPDPRNQAYQEPVNRGNEVPYGPSNDTVRSSDMGSAHAQSQYESRVDPMGNRVESHEEVFEDKNQSRANIRYWITRITYFVLGVLEVILLLRFIFRLLGANQDNAFVIFLYN